MTQLLDPLAGGRVLEIGTGSGYQAAVLAAMGCDVLGIERLADLAETARDRLDALGYRNRVEIRVADGGLGCPTRRLVADHRRGRGAGSPRRAGRPARRRRAVGDPGRRSLGAGSDARRAARAALATTNHGLCVFVPLRGAAGWP